MSALRNAQIAAGMLALVMAAPDAEAELVSTRHFSSFEQVQPHISAGFEFVARADTENLRLTVDSPPAADSTPFGIWNEGVPHAFKVVYNASGLAGIEIDDLFADQTAPISPQTNGLLITAHAAGEPLASAHVANLRLTLPDFTILDIADAAAAPATDYLLLETTAPLAAGFILSGTVEFDWAETIPPPADLWFEAAPVVVVPEPTSLISLAAAILAACGARLRISRPKASCT